MTILTRKLWVGLLILAAFAFVIGAVVMYGIEEGLASLGTMVLIGMAGIGTYVLAKALRRSDTSLKGGCLECGSTPAMFLDSDDLKHITCNKPVEAGPVTEEDKRLIMKHIDGLFAKGEGQSGEMPTVAGPVTKADKRLIMKHIDGLFAKGEEQSGEMPAVAGPITKADKRLIMKHIDGLFAKGGEQGSEMPC